ncbi:MAG: hypothetical protein ACJ73S_31215 [Mycobacteriales bacterium]
MPTCADVQAKNPGLPPLTTTTRVARPGRNQILICATEGVTVQVSSARTQASVIMPSLVRTVVS